MASKADNKKGGDGKKTDNKKGDSKKSDKPKKAAAPKGAAAGAAAPAAAAKPAAAAVPTPAAAAKAAAAPAATAAAAKPAASTDAKKAKKAKPEKPAGAAAAGAAAPKAAPKAKAKAAAAGGVDQKAPFLKKIKKSKLAVPSELEQAVAQAYVELEQTDLKADLTDLYFVAAKEVGVEGGKKAVVVFVPFAQHGKYKKIQSRLIRELEKKLGRHVTVIAQRTIMSKNFARSHPGQVRPRSRTLTAVHNAILEDLVYPTLIVGKRLRVRVDGSRLLKVQLDPKDVKEVENKLKTFSAVYSALTNKKVEFVFPLGDD